MTLDTDSIIKLASTAETDNPIAVFVEHDQSLGAFSARQLRTRVRMRAEPHNLIGVFHRECLSEDVRYLIDRKLNAAG